MSRSRQPKVASAFVWATGQDDNLGDSLLRRPLTRSVSTASGLEVFVGGASDEFLEGLAPPPNATLHRGFARWAVSAAASALVRRTVLVVNAGEVRVSRRGAVRMSTIVLAAALAWFRGGGIVWVGAGVPNPAGWLSLPYRWVGRSASVLYWRDEVSVAIRPGSRVAPDWAFGEGPDVPAWTPLGQRTHVGVVLRGDRETPSDEWIRWVRALADAAGLRLLVAVQVRRDTKRAAELAERLGADVVEWHPGVGHAAQEARVRQAYAMCSAVIGDRLHGLIVAATEGAVPLGWVETSGGKVGRHFASVGYETAGRFEGAAVEDYPDARLVVESLRTGEHVRVGHLIERTRSQLDDVRQELGSFLNGPGGG